MEPTLRDGDHLLVRWGAKPARGELVVVQWPDKPLSVKRAAYLDGDGWWVERDNPLEGTDSWSAGPLPADQVLAVVLFRLWPPRRHRPTN
jgi:hypothetical protein